MNLSVVNRSLKQPVPRVSAKSLNVKQLQMDDGIKLSEHYLSYDVKTFTSEEAM